MGDINDIMNDLSFEDAAEWGRDVRQARMKEAILPAGTSLVGLGVGVGVILLMDWLESKKQQEQPDPPRYFSSNRPMTYEEQGISDIMHRGGDPNEVNEDLWEHWKKSQGI